MTTAGTTPEPRTAAGQRMDHLWGADWKRDEWRDAILAIEAQARPAIAAEGLPNAVAGVKGFVSRPLADRLWEKVQVGEGCWLWRGATRSPDPERAYGIIWVDGAHRPAAKVMWELAHGESFPEGMDALHTCDNPPCVNPLHIFPGTPRDNAIDMVRKGRHGNQVGGTHLTEADVLEIRSSGLTVNELAARFAVGDDAIRLILNRETWRHV